MEKNPVIESQRALIAKMRADLHTAEAVLKGMQLVEASIVHAQPVTPSRGQVPRPAVKANEPAQGSGKPKGSISMNWRSVLGTFYAVDAKFSAAEVVARENWMHGRMLNQRAVRRLFDGYAEHGFIEIGDDGLYRVTDTAAERFGFDRAPLAERVVNEAEGASEGDTSASSLFSNQEGGDVHAATITTS